MVVCVRWGGIERQTMLPPIAVEINPIVGTGLCAALSSVVNASAKYQQAAENLNSEYSEGVVEALPKPIDCFDVIHG